ncbi:uncharacterized protein LAESUDRAFT_142529 [Laetiporus sulphureus 93-53]|uniref:Uncharacterized protein n=1 Tax=Laetiporus sulphureus 93-53 TaxID=1314785 RepID=A0A165EEX7_9APHY|nr:uncharacterized protein LAESUDRAFT_142529 [Laetiporus sulphureus 93-53]KZT06906.1 hypothetical protein LAESUDRAFT_142529 [Laetiporus sulphureus 93-53]
MPPSLLWRRKTSTPFFPGAWPNSSVSSHGDDAGGRIVTGSVPDDPPQLPELLHVRAQHRGASAVDAEQGDIEMGMGVGWMFPTALEHHGFEDNGFPVGVLNTPALTCTPEMSDLPLNTSVSQDTTFTEVSDSEGVLTPESNHDAPWNAPPISDSQKMMPDFLTPSVAYPDKYADESYATTRSIPSGHDTSLETIPARPKHFNNNTSIPMTDATPDTTMSTSLSFLDQPVLNFSTISLDFTSISYATASMGDSPSSVGSPSNSMSAAFSASFPLSGDIDAALEDPRETSISRASAQEHTAKSLGGEHNMNTGNPSHPSSVSAYSFADSPVLPPEADSGHSPHVLVHKQPSPRTSADLDAFARAAAAAASAMSSTLSLPASIHSAVVCEAERVIIARKACASPHMRAYTSDSDAPSLALAVNACATTSDGHGHRYDDSEPTPEAEAENEDPVDLEGAKIMKARIRRQSAPLPHSPHTPLPRVTRTISSPVDVGPPPEQGVREGAGRDRPMKLLVFGRMRKLGGRIVSLFGGKGAEKERRGSLDGSAKLGVQRTTTTAVTEVGYRPMHPIPAPEIPARDVRTSRRSLSLPMSMLPSVYPRTPKTPRCESFLPLEDEAAGHPLLSRPFHMRGHKSASVQPAAENHKEGGHIIRARTVTAPTIETISGIDGRREAQKARRFSVSSVLTKSRMDALKATVMPHPPVPDFPRSVDHEPVNVDDSVVYALPVRPMSMLSGIGLDARQSEVNVGPSRSAAAHVADKKSSKRPAGHASIALGSSSESGAKRTVDDSHASRSSPAALEETVKLEKRMDERDEVRPTSMDRQSRGSMIEVSGSHFRMHQPSKGKDEQRAALGVAYNPDEGLPDTTMLATEPTRIPSSPASAMYDRLPVESSNAVQQPQRSTEPNDQAEIQVQSRRFSLSSVISRRAMRARSMIVSVGRRSDLDVTEPTTPTGPSSIGRRVRGSTFSTILDAGVRFDMFTPGFGFSMPSSPPRPARAETASPTSHLSNDLDFRRSRAQTTPEMLEVGDYVASRPESELDTMSFARSATFTDSCGSMFEREVDGGSSRAISLVDGGPRSTIVRTTVRGEGEESDGEPGAAFDEEGETPTTKHIDLSPSLSMGIRSSMGSEEEPEDARAMVEKEEERRFLRALGLEFGETTRGGR